MVSSNDTDGGQVKWLAGRLDDLVRGSGRLAGTGAGQVDGVRYTAAHVVVATGADPITPPVPGLQGLAGVWGTREAMADGGGPARLLVLGGGPAGVELAEVVRRFGGEVVLIEGGPPAGAKPAPLGEALADACARTASSSISARWRRRCDARATSSSSSWATGGRRGASAC